MFLGKIINSGIQPKLDSYQKREIRITNLFSLITLIGTILGVVTVLFVSGAYPTYVTLFIGTTSVFVLFFNYKGKYSLATYFFVVPIAITLFLLCEQYDEAAGNYLYYFLVVFCVAVLHNPSKKGFRTILFFGILMFSFLATKFIKIESLLIKNITTKDVQVLFVYNQMLAMSLAIVSVYLVVKLINKQNNETLVLLSKEKESQVKISQSLKEKEVLLAEIQHRVKNNLAIITGLLNLQTEKAPCEESRLLMIESRNRVMSMAMVHDSLYKKDNLSKIDLKQYLSELVNELAKTFPVRGNEVDIVTDLDEIEIDLTKAVPIGLIVNEALTNSLKHAFNDETISPKIRLVMRLIIDEIQVLFADNGVGFGDPKLRRENALGLSLIESLSEQIDAKVSFKNEGGANIELIIPQK